jgi:hypothetical protein
VGHWTSRPITSSGKRSWRWQDGQRMISGMTASRSAFLLILATEESRIKR